MCCSLACVGYWGSIRWIRYALAVSAETGRGLLAGEVSLSFTFSSWRDVSAAGSVADRYDFCAGVIWKMTLPFSYTIRPPVEAALVPLFIASVPFFARDELSPAEPAGCFRAAG